MNFRIRIFLVLLCCLQSVLSYEQAKTQRCDARWIDTVMISVRNQEKMKMTSLEQSTDSFYFRYLTDNHVVDIWSEDGVAFHGSVTNYTKSYESYNWKTRTTKPARYFFNKEILDSITVKKVHAQTLKIAAIPTDDSINHGLVIDDGFFYVVQTANSDFICEKHYSYYNQNDTLGTNQGMMNAFVRNMDTILDLPNRYKRFFDSLKPGSYHNGIAIVQKLSPKVLAAIKRNEPFVAYVNSMEDTLNTYLTDTLTKIFTAQPPFDCSFKTFFLHFSTENRLTKIKHYRHHMPYDKEERKELRQCDRRIKKAFKKIRPDFMHSQIRYVQKLEFEDGIPIFRRN